MAAVSSLFSANYVPATTLSFDSMKYTPLCDLPSLSVSATPPVLPSEPLPSARRMIVRSVAENAGSDARLSRIVVFSILIEASSASILSSMPYGNVARAQSPEPYASRRGGTFEPCLVQHPDPATRPTPQPHAALCGLQPTTIGPRNRIELDVAGAKRRNAKCSIRTRRPDGITT